MKRIEGTTPHLQRLERMPYGHNIVDILLLNRSNHGTTTNAGHGTPACQKAAGTKHKEERENHKKATDSQK